MPSLSTIDQQLVPRYVQAYSALRDWIVQGRYPAGSRLPSESELCKMFGVSRITIRAAVEMLEKQKLVQRNQGRGTFVLKAAHDAPSRGSFDELVRRLSVLGGKSDLQDLQIDAVPAGADVAEDLGIDPGDTVERVTYVRFQDKQPTGLTNIYVPSSLGIRFTREEVRAIPAPTLLESKGYRISGAHQLIGATAADSVTAEKLKTTVGAPIVTVRLRVLDENDKPVELLSARYRADRYVHHVYLAAESTSSPR